MENNAFEITPELIAAAGVNLEQVKELAEIFQLVDEDHGGTIGRQELENLMKTLRIKSNQEELDYIMVEAGSLD